MGKNTYLGSREKSRLGCQRLAQSNTEGVDVSHEVFVITGRNPPTKKNFWLGWVDGAWMSKVESRVTPDDNKRIVILLLKASSHHEELFGLFRVTMNFPSAVTFMPRPQS